MNEEKTVYETEPTPERKPVEGRPARAVKAKSMKVDNCSKLNVRAEPAADAEVLGTLDRGTIVKVDPTFKDETFAKVKADFMHEADAPEFAYLNKAFLAEV